MLKIQVGDTKPVVFRIEGHSDLNGAVLPAGTTVTLTSNAPEIATVPSTAAFDTDAQSLDVPVTVTQVEGSTDISAQLATPDGTVFNFSDTLVVSAAAPAPLTHVTGTLLQP